MADKMADKEPDKVADKVADKIFELMSDEIADIVPEKIAAKMTGNAEDVRETPSEPAISPRARTDRSVTIAYSSPVNFEMVPGTKINGDKMRRPNRSIALTSTLLPATEGLAAKSTLLFDLVDKIYNGHISKEGELAHHRNDTRGTGIQSEVAAMLHKAKGTSSSNHANQANSANKKQPEPKVINTWRRNNNSSSQAVRKPKASSEEVASEDGTYEPGLDITDQAIVSEGMATPTAVEQRSPATSRPQSRHTGTNKTAQNSSLPTTRTATPDIAMSARNNDYSSLIPRITTPAVDPIPPQNRLLTPDDNDEFTGGSVTSLTQIQLQRQNGPTNRQTILRHHEIHPDKARSTRVIYGTMLHGNQDSNPGNMLRTHRASSHYSKQPISPHIRSVLAKSSRSRYWMMPEDEVLDTEPNIITTFTDFHRTVCESNEEENFLVKVGIAV
jgi:hypothetical protein